MNAAVGRRAFVGSAMTLGAGIGAAAIGVGSIGVAGAGGAVNSEPGFDGVYNEIVGQFMRAVGRMQSSPGGEAARQVGSSLRLLAEWGKAHGLDETIRRGVDDAVRRRGREAILAQQFDLGAEIVMRGWKLPPGFEPTATAADFADSLDDLRRHGITQHWFDYADAFEQAAQRLDKESKLLTRVGYAQPNDCYGAVFMLLMLESQLFLACSVGLAVGPELCAIATALALAWKWRMWWLGC
jgi:hypothetical protein